MVTVRRYRQRRSSGILKLLVFSVLLLLTGVVYLTQVADRGLIFHNGPEMDEKLKSQYLDFMRGYKISRIVAAEGKYSFAGIRIYKKGFFWARSIDHTVPDNSGFVVLREGDQVILKTSGPNRVTRDRNYMRFVAAMLQMIRKDMLVKPSAAAPAKDPGLSLFDKNL